MSTPEKAAAVPVWHCDFKDVATLTVGTKFEMDCKGDLPIEWKGQPKAVLPEKAQPYSLVILSTKKLESTAAEFVVTSYRAGDFKPEYVRVMAGDVGFEASGLEFKVQSVLKQGQQPQPYGPYGPFQLALPIWVWVAVALFVATLSSAVWIWFRRIQDRRQLADDLAKYTQTLMSPSAQFHKDLRQLSRKLISSKSTESIGEWNATLDHTIRVYLLREFQYLTLKGSHDSLLTGLKRKNRDVYIEHSSGLEKIFKEMDRFQTHAGKHEAGEFEQILNLARQWCDRIEKRKVKRT